MSNVSLEPKMIFKKLLLAAVIAVAASHSAVALAGPLGGIIGAVEFKLSGLTTGFFTQANTTEVTWGVGNITQITTPTTAGAASLWNSGEGGEYLGYMLYGIHDISSTVAGSVFTNYSDGATGIGCGTLCGSIYIDLFKRTSNPSITTPSARTGYNAYTGVSTADLWLRLALTPGIVANDVTTVPNEGTTAALVQTLTALTLPASGGGTFYANVVAGSAFSQFNTNGFTTLLNTSADMYGIFDLRDNTVGAGATCSPTSVNCFFGLIRDPVSANAIPEPGSIALLGLGLLLMSRRGLGRRRMRPARD
jgi:hypothetical protein